MGPVLQKINSSSRLSSCMLETIGSGIFGIDNYERQEAFSLACGGNLSAFLSDYSVPLFSLEITSGGRTFSPALVIFFFLTNSRTLSMF